MRIGFITGRFLGTQNTKGAFKKKVENFFNNKLYNAGIETLKKNPVYKPHFKP